MYLDKIHELRKTHIDFEFYFKPVSETLKMIRESNLISIHKTEFLNTIALSRYVGVIDINFHERLLMQIFLNTTDRVSLDYRDLRSISGIIIDKQAHETSLISFIEAMKDSDVNIAYE